MILEGVRRMLSTRWRTRPQRLQASNGLEAIELAHSLHPDVIVMDLDILSWTGPKPRAVDQIYQWSSDISVLAVTGQNDSENPAWIKDDCDVFIEKAVRVDETGRGRKAVVAQIGSRNGSGEGSQLFLIPHLPFPFPIPHSPIPHSPFPIPPLRSIISLSVQRKPAQ